ncbi:SGNH/GDSL hydrolase family protein [Pelagibacterales bacterium SAG-MED33]|nr:SGNH/GDSL hydrolase family protein [Pelagibacterales bacterium SAG-MED33]
MKNFLVLSITLFFFVFLAEISLRVFYPLNLTGDISNYEYDENLGIKLKDNLNSVYITDHRQEVITNKKGTLNYESEFSNYDNLIITIGDSNTQGVGVPFDSSYPFVLYTQLNSEDKESWGVVNMALAAYGTKQAILVYKIKYKIFMKPKFVTYLADKNDYMGDLFFDKGYKHMHLVKNSPRFFGYAEILGYVSQKIELIKRIKYILSETKLSQNYNKVEENFEKVFLNNYAKKLLEFNNYLRNNQISFIFAWNSLDENKNNVCSSEYNFVKNWAKQNNIIFADWCPNFKKIANLSNAIPVINDHSSSHARPWINRIIAQSFRDKILNHK